MTEDTDERRPKKAPKTPRAEPMARQQPCMRLTGVTSWDKSCIRCDAKTDKGCKFK